MSDTADTSTARKDFTTRLRPFVLDCPLCDRTWTGMNLPKLAKHIASHWNTEHSGDIHGKTQIDTVERGGHQTVGNHWQVERIPIYLTAFDVLEERLGQEDGWATVGDEETVCQECLRETPEADDRIVTDSSGYHDEWRCRECFERAELTRKRETNRSLDEYAQSV
jgi:hypothetical protein